MGCIRADAKIKGQWAGYNELPLAAGEFWCTFEQEPVIVDYLNAIIADLDMYGAILANCAHVQPSKLSAEIPDDQERGD
ncbi:hypothetical protein ON010_g2565 [Phytophthora cinnamomi]|nr:hypothetical protein ON010_g2565 [Phytophthora cinnamomi]